MTIADAIDQPSVPAPAGPHATDPRVDLPDSLRPLTAMHDAMRRDVARLRSAVAGGLDPAAAARAGTWFGRVTEVILHHHRVEDDMLYPAIEEWLPGFVDTATTLTGEHHELDDALDAVAASLARLAGVHGYVAAAADHREAAERVERLDQVLEHHLVAEEATVIPAIRDVVPPASFAETEDRINRTGTLRFAAFALPWVLDEADPRSAAVILESLPLPFRLLHRLVWVRSYERASMRG